ncbi:penicillin-binding protein activator LpoB [Helicobacter sp. MIT 14-3879]|uniref:penicillin-binding protein activator LpoB n=1 Tax=Helicobacter sp. MIT 14-3879 TaxID=2040649 RepID=UPI000E1EB1C2|nr:penicillin-binding protein activator LpoB [Helicobacter sp. MIT 14-3879]RDU65463.1 penicillin-binding protein activator LpoB [Helicobacter sp. MIT 14-3879]
MKIYLLWFSIILSIFAGCSNKVEYISLKDSKEYTTSGLDYHDIEDAAQKGVESLLSSKYTKSINSNKPKVLAISDVINDTMQLIDTEQLTRKVTREMRNSGKYILTLAITGNGAMEDTMINKARNTRDNDEFNQYTTIEKGELISPELSLSGKIIQKNTKLSSSKQRIDYYFLLTLTDIKSGLVLWDDEINIIKVGSNNNVAW